MKKFVLLTIVFMLITGCSKETEQIEDSVEMSVVEEDNSIISTKDEWINMFDIKNYNNVLVEQSCIYTDLDIEDENSDESYSQKLTISIDSNIIKVVNNGHSIYYNKSEDELKMKTYNEIAKDAYSYIETEYSKEELDGFYSKLTTSYITGGYDFSKYYDLAKYDDTKKCYSFEFKENNTSFDVEIFPVDGLISKIIVYSTNNDDNYSMQLTTILSNYNNVSLKLPIINNEIYSGEEWDNMFDSSRYKNCTAYRMQDGYEEVSEINEDLIHYISTNYNDDENHEYYYVKLENNSQRIIEINEDGTTNETEEKISGRKGIRKFEDYYIVNSVKENLQGLFNEVEKVDDHYELTINDEFSSKLIKVFVSSGYITNIDIEESINSIVVVQNITITNYNHTIIR